MHLIIDIGNTRSKLAIYDNRTLVSDVIEDKLNAKIIEALLKEFRTINKCIVSASGHLSDKLIDNLRYQIDQVLIFDQSTPLPFSTLYTTPKTIGLDRLAAIAGAQLHYPNTNTLVIDAGTAITYDFINDEGLHLGGNISPGLEMRFQALNTFTEKLPLVNSEISEMKLLGLSTDEALKYGVINGILAEIEGYIAKLDTNYKNLTVILTGGDTQFFVNKLKKTIFVVRNLVSSGLNTILKYNVANN